MPKYRITEKAGRFVAGHRNTGVGTVLDIPGVAADYELKLGTLVPHDLVPPAIEATAEDPGLQSPEPELPDAGPELPDSDEGLTDSAAPEAEPLAAAVKRKRRR
jgi:hypothetical protein